MCTQTGVGRGMLYRCEARSSLEWTADCLQRCNKTHKLVWAGDVHMTGLCYVGEHNKRKRSQFYSCSIVLDRSVNHLFSQAKNQIKLTISNLKPNLNVYMICKDLSCPWCVVMPLNDSEHIKCYITLMLVLWSWCLSRPAHLGPVALLRQLKPVTQHTLVGVTWSTLILETVNTAQRVTVWHLVTHIQWEFRLIKPSETQ